MDITVTEETTQIVTQENSTILQVQEAATLVLAATEASTAIQVSEPQTTVIEVGLQGPAGPPGSGSGSSGPCGPYICTPHVLTEDAVIPSGYNGGAIGFLEVGDTASLTVEGGALFYILDP